MLISNKTINSSEHVELLGTNFSQSTRIRTNTNDCRTSWQPNLSQINRTLGLIVKPSIQDVCHVLLSWDLEKHHYVHLVNLKTLNNTESDRYKIRNRAQQNTLNTSRDAVYVLHAGEWRAFRGAKKRSITHTCCTQPVRLKTADSPLWVTWSHQLVVVKGLVSWIMGWLFDNG